jgi:16S rRNA (cytosine1402-N4)-methyltransferase
MSTGLLSFMTEPVDPSAIHTPVLIDEIVSAFDFGRPAVIVDGTLGLGGHTERLLSRYESLSVIGFDWDDKALAIARGRLERFGHRARIERGSYADLPEFLLANEIRGVDGLLLDLGLSSLQIEDSERGFSFRLQGPLDMRMSDTTEKSAWDLLVLLSAEELAGIFRAYGEEPRAWAIAKGLKEAISTKQISNDAWAVAETIRRWAGRPGRTDPATRCFQALRIAVNGELNNLDHFLAHLEPMLNPGGRAAIISFHSLEDRRVKTAFHMAAKGCVCPPQIPQCICGEQAWARLIERKAIQPTEAEIVRNPRARSAKLRLLEKL